MNLLNFVSQYPDESACRIKFKEIRDKQVVVRYGDHYRKKNKENYACKKCDKRQILRANTVMHGFQLPFHYWFIVIYLLTSTKKSFSALELQRRLGHKYYEPVWTMLHKLRMALVKRYEAHELSGVLELDEGFFITELDEEEKEKPLKRGRGSRRKSKVFVMAESDPIADNDSKASSKNSSRSEKKPRKVGHIKMIVMEDLKSETITPIVEANLSKESVIDSDGSTSSYGKL